jgi:hypothetical protein
MVKEKYSSSLMLFQTFISACPSLAAKATPELVKVGATTEEMDWPLIRYSMSLMGRIGMSYHSYKQINEINELAVEEIVKQKEQPVGTVSSMPNQLLLINYFESLVDQIHKTMETIGIINLFLFPIDWENLTKEEWRHLNSFNYQRKLILLKKLTFGENYDNIMTTLDWFDELRDIRDNSNHTMSGLPVSDTDVNGRIVPMYYVHICLGRGDAKNGVVQYPIKGRTEHYFIQFQSCLEKIGRCYVEHLDQDKKFHMPIFNGENMSVQELCLREFLETDKYVLR